MKKATKKPVVRKVVKAASKNVEAKSSKPDVQAVLAAKLAEAKKATSTAKAKLAKADAAAKVAKAKVTKARRAEAAKVEADPKKDGIPVGLQVQNRKPLSKEDEARIQAVIDNAKRNGMPKSGNPSIPKASDPVLASKPSKPAEKASSSIEKLAALLAGATGKAFPTAAVRGVLEGSGKSGGNVTQFPTFKRTKAIPPGTPLKVGDVRVGMKVRIYNTAGVLSKQVYTILPKSDDEIDPGPEYFAYTDEDMAHIINIVSA